MAFDITRFGSDSSNVKSILDGVRYYRYFNKDNNTLTTPGYFPADLGLNVGDRIAVVPSTKTNADEMYIVTSVANRVVTVTKVTSGGGAVDSVNGQTGAVVLDAEDVGALPSSTTIPDAVQYSTMPTASADNEGQIVQFVGATDTYTNGYFYKCTGAGEPVVYSWSQVDVQPAPDPLPSQTGNNGKFLSTNGTTASWETVGGLPSQTGQSGKFLTTDGTDASWSNKPVINSASNVTQNLAINCYDNNNTLGSIGISSEWNIGSIEGATGGVNIGGGSISANYAIQLGGTNQATHNNPDANTFKVGNNNGNFEMMDANGKIPADRLGTGFDATKTQTLKNVNGVLTWVDD